MNPMPLPPFPHTTAVLETAGWRIEFFMEENPNRHNAPFVHYRINPVGQSFYKSGSTVNFPPRDGSRTTAHVQLTVGEIPRQVDRITARLAWDRLVEWGFVRVPSTATANTGEKP